MKKRELKKSWILKKQNYEGVPIDNEKNQLFLGSRTNGDEIIMQCVRKLAGYFVNYNMCICA